MLREQLSLNRRAALGATAAAALAAGALAGSAASAKADEAPVWDDSADIVVIGGSGALAAAAYAAEAGLSTIVLEKTGACGGNNKVNGGTFFTCGSRAQMEQGVKDPRSGEDDSIELGIADAASATGARATARSCRPPLRAATRSSTR